MFSISQCILLLNVNYNNDNFELQMNIVKLKEGKPSLCQNKLAESALFRLFECLQWGKSKYGIKCLPIWMLHPIYAPLQNRHASNIDYVIEVKKKSSFPTQY